LQSTAGQKPGGIQEGLSQNFLTKLLILGSEVSD